MIAMLMMMMMMMIMIIMTVEMNYVEDTIILDDKRKYQMIMINENYFAGTTISKTLMGTIFTYQTAFKALSRGRG